MLQDYQRTSKCSRVAKDRLDKLANTLEQWLVFFERRPFSSFGTPPGPEDIFLWQSQVRELLNEVSRLKQREEQSACDLENPLIREYGTDSDNEDFEMVPQKITQGKKTSLSTKQMDLQKPTQLDPDQEKPPQMNTETTSPNNPPFKRSGIELLLAGVLLKKRASRQNVVRRPKELRPHQKSPQLYKANTNWSKHNH